MKPRSITRRLIFSVVLTQLVLTGAVVALATYLTKWQLGNALDSALYGRAMSVSALVRFSEDQPPHLLFDSEMAPPSLDHRHPDMYEVLDSDGNLIARSPNWTDHLLSPQRLQSSSWTAHVGHETYRVVQLRNTPVLDSEGPGTESTKITVLYAVSTQEMRERVWSVAGLTCIGSLLLLAIATSVIVFLVRKGLSPLAALAGNASHVTAQDWKLRASDEAYATAELAPLTDAMDRMLSKLEQAFTSQRDFVANAAHELKTPIAVLKSTLQLALQKPRTADEYQRQLQDAVDDVARLESLVHSLLRLARAEQLLEKKSAELPVIDLAASCELSAERCRPFAKAKEIRIEVVSSADPQVHGDPDDLETIWNNLLDNAIRYSPRGAVVQISVYKQNGDCRVDVKNQGPGIAAEDIEAIFERFHRADASRSRETGGYGLGLAIAKAMTEAYGGKIAAKYVAGSGTVFSVSLPALP